MDARGDGVLDGRGNRLSCPYLDTNDIRAIRDIFIFVKVDNGGKTAGLLARIL